MPVENNNQTTDHKECLDVPAAAHALLGLPKPVLDPLAK
jgi:hypothetical protein